MIIKNDNTKLETKITKGKSNIGLMKDDVWCIGSYELLMMI